MFKILKKSTISRARLGELKTPHGLIQTPFFMPVATQGTVKNLTSQELKELGAQVILSNTYHLMLRPGVKIIKKAGGLHKFINWLGPILTDSGGFQVFSLARIRKILPRGVEFSSHLDGQKILLTPEKTLKIQRDLGSDIMMVLDVPSPYPCSYGEAERGVQLTTKWTKSSLKWRNKWREVASIFAIVQGSVYKDLRLKSAKELIALDFDGYAIGGLAVGEPEKEMWQVLDWVLPNFPENKPRYLMGVGWPEQIVEAVRRGIDMFDCVIPTREARHGRIYKFKIQNSKFKMTIQNSKFYEIINIKNESHKMDFKPIDANCLCYTCTHHSRAYLRHLFSCGEPLALRLATLHNLSFYLELMRQIRKAIKDNNL